MIFLVHEYLQNIIDTDLLLKLAPIALQIYIVDVGKKVFECFTIVKEIHL